jgi:N-methylhydantoinase A/oxoprolinase/acetone carboxylase beta subunit
MNGHESGMPQSRTKYRIGVDVGGTNTDAVIMAGRTVLAGVKAPTTWDVTSGVLEALVGVLEKSGVAREAIAAVVIGTTHFTNAIIERRHLSPIAVVRLGLPATRCLPPMVDWPDDLREAVALHVALAHGGNEFDGREISSIDEDELRRIGRDVAAKGIRAIALSSVFSPVDSRMETQAASVLASACPGARVVLSSHIGRLGLLERENAAILNASLLDLAERTVDAFATALQGCGLTCRFFISQNDGTLMDGAQVKRYPVLTVCSGPTNSMRGAAFLSGHPEAIVIDVGGTTTDVGLLQHGFPGEVSTTVSIGGVRTNFRMPDVFSFGLGGGSIVEKQGDGIVVGPRSVGYEITQKALTFGGGVLTATDVAVGLGLAEIGDASRVVKLDAGMLRAAKQVIDGMVERAVERSRVSAARIPVIAVGGGSILVQDRIGDLDVVRPENFAVANAVGAAIAQVSGEVDRVFTLSGSVTRERALSEAEATARDKALAAGAVADKIVTVEREDVPLAYLPGNATRIRVKVVGDIEI